MEKRRAKDPRVAKMPKAAEPHHDDSADARAFEREMADVVRLPEDPRGRVRTVRNITPKSLPTSSAERPGRPDGDTEPDHDFTAPGVDRREIRKLKRGEYVVGGRCDLHGMTAADACASVKQFIDNSRHSRYRCVCIVHGRGLHSERMTSVVKARVRNYLRTHPSVLAYADAPASDGGPGAVYVLLRSK